MDPSQGTPSVNASSTADAALYFAADEAAVALDYLNNLLGPSGKDVQARASVSRWRRKAERAGDTGSDPRSTSKWLLAGPAIPQGDQLRRTRNAVEMAIAEIQRAIAHPAPEDAYEIWAALVAAHETLDYIGCLDALSITPHHHKVTSADVGAAINLLNASIAAMNKARGSLTLLRLRRQ